MSACGRVTDWLLEAGPGDLDAAPAELAGHIEGCESCTARLAAVDRVTVDLAEWLDHYTAGLAEEEAVRLALGGRAGHGNRAPSRRWARPAARLAPLAAAAAAVVLVLRGPAGPDAGVIPPLPEPEPEESYALAVEAPEDGRIAVFQTKNPKIHVVWLYQTPDIEMGGER